MPIYEYVADQCRREESCSRRKEYLQRITEPALTACRECGAPIRRILSSFAARSGEVGVSRPDPTPLNITNIPAPRAMPGSEGSGCGHDH
ncbi:FmdB family zinc ribbon protein [Nitrospira sp. Kam-Ns4a]